MQYLRQTFLVVAAFLSAAVNFPAQSYSVVPNDTIQLEGTGFEDLETITISQLNISSNTIYFKWQKVSESVPVGWEASICDNLFCNTSLADSGTMAPVVPGESGFLLLHITPFIDYGTAVIRYAVWDVEFPELKDTVTFMLSLDAPSAINDQKFVPGSFVYPNPARSNIVLSNQFETFNYSISDLSGKQLKRGFMSENSSPIAVEELPDGICFISVEKADKVITFKFIVAHDYEK